MGGKPRGNRKELARLRCELRAQGWTYVQIASHIREIMHVNSRVAFRLAHGLTQQAVADRWNELYPSADGTGMMTAKQISYWESWPQSGRKPDIEALNRLARIYCCQAADLLDGEDYRYLDEATQQEIAKPTVATVRYPPHSPSPLGLPSIPALRGLGDSRSDLSLAIACAPEATILSDQVELPDKLAAVLLRHLGILVSTATEGGSSARQRDAAFTQLVQLLTAWATNMDRREVLRILGWAATAVTATPIIDTLTIEEQERVALAIQAPGRVDEAVIEHSEEVLWRCMRQDDALGPQAALDTVLAQRNLVRVMLTECPAVHRTRLLSLFSNLSRFVGWLSFDLGDFDSGSYFYEQARTSAHEAENTELGAFVLCNMSHLATWQGKPRTGIDHAVAAQSWAKRTDDFLLQAYTSDVAARAYAHDGQRAACLAELESAGRTVAGGSGRPARLSFAYFYGPGQFAATQSQCYLRLQDAGQAIRAASTSLELLDPSFVRNIAFGKLTLASAHVRDRDIDHAATVLSDAGAFVAHNHSARLMQQLHSGRAQLEQWKNTRAVRALDDQLSAYGLLRRDST